MAHCSFFDLASETAESSFPIPPIILLGVLRLLTFSDPAHAIKRLGSPQQKWSLARARGLPGMGPTGIPFSGLMATVLLRENRKR